MSPLSRRILHVVCILFVSTALHAQIYTLHDAEIGVSATGQFTTTVSAPTYAPAIEGLHVGLPSSCFTETSKIESDHAATCAAAPAETINGMGLLEPDTTDSPGVLVTFRERPVKWATIELNYQYTKFSERFYDVPGQSYTTDSVFVPTNMQEATAAYLLHFHQRGRMNPFVSVGGGALFFSPIMAPDGSQPVNTSQWRGTGLVEMGVDLQTDSRLGFRLGARDLIYRAPSFAITNVGSTWVSTEEPYAGVYIKLSKSGQ